MLDLNTFFYNRIDASIVELKKSIQVLKLNKFVEFYLQRASQNEGFKAYEKECRKNLKAFYNYFK